MFSELNNLCSPKIICIQDTAAEPGRFLIRELVSNSKVTNVHVLCYDCISTQLQEGLSNLGKTIHIHDCLPALTPDSDTEDGIENVIKSMGKKYQTQIIILDSASTLFLQKPVHRVYRILRKLIGYCYAASELIFILHEDTLLNARQIIAHLKLLCNVWIRVLQGPRVTLAIRKSTGKLSTETYNCGSSLSEKTVWQKEENVNVPSKPVSNGGPVSTFKLTLSESEKKERDAVKLPYERHDDDNELSSSATITYEPDEFDDWDEEDPDNDLEFS